MIALLLCLLASEVVLVQAQPRQPKPRITIKGVVYDSSAGTALKGATALLLYPSDSSSAAYTTTDSAGRFTLRNVDTGRYLLTISFAGYRSLVAPCKVPPQSTEFVLDTLRLVPDTNMLQDVVITRPPVMIKNDTVEFRASAVKTQPNATAEDLVKRLPGMEVDQEGNVTAQGEEITRIYVDGKEFFSNDPKVALKNLTAELIESIQVFEDMSDQARFTRIDDGSRIRTINIKLKKDRRKGVFGRAMAGMGTSDRYAASLSSNMFLENTQLSILGSANNVNRPGFTLNDLEQSLNNNNRGNNNRNSNSRNAINNGNRIGGGYNGEGNTDLWSLGFNYRDLWGKKTTVGASYFVSNTDRSVRSTNYRQNFFPNDSASYTNNESLSRSQTTNHNLNMRIEYNIDSMNSLLIIPNVVYTQNASRNVDTISTRGDGKTTDYLAITGTNRRVNDRRSLTINNNLLFRHRFAKPGRTFTIGWNTSIGNSDLNGLTETPYSFYRPDSSLQRTTNIRQRNSQPASNFNNTISTSFTEMWAPGKLFEINYAYTNNQSISDRKTYDYNPVSDKYDSLNKPLTNYFENGFISSRLGANYRTKKQKYDYQLGGAVQWATLNNLSHRATTSKDSIMKQRYVNFFPNASFNYSLGTRQSLRFQYRGSTRAPSITQLQDVVDITNPVRWRSGNPNLKQEFTNNLTVNLNTFNTKTFMYINGSLQANLISNRIVNGIDTVSSKVQLIRPENVSGAFGFNASGTIGIPLKKVASGRRSPMNLNLTTSLRYNRDVSLLYKEVNYNYNTSVTQRVAFVYNITDKMDLNTSASLTYNDTRYTVQQNLNNRFFNQRYVAELTTYWFKRLSVASDADITINTGRSDGFNQTVPLWNASVGWLLFKKRNGEIKLSVVDILNQNKSIQRNTGDNFIDDRYIQVLQRFYMVTFMLNLNRFGGKAAPAPGGRGNYRQGTRTN